MEIAYIDHYDSFSRNVVAWLKLPDHNLSIDLIAFDDSQKIAKLLHSPKPLVLSPGPGSPTDYNSTLKLVKTLWGKVSMVGICLGHQILAHVAGASIVKHPDPHHGIARSVRVMQRSSSLFAGVPETFNAASYNSLSVYSPDFSSQGIEVLATDEYERIQAIEIKSPSHCQILGLQFHPDSFLTEHAEILARNCLNVLSC